MLEFSSYLPLFLNHRLFFVFTRALYELLIMDILVHWYALSRLTFYYCFKVIVFFSVSSPRSGNEEGNGLKFEQHLFHENLL